MTITLSTPRLTLRPPQDSDWPAYRAYRLSSRSTVVAEDKGMIWGMFAALFGHWDIRGFGRFIALDRQTAQPIGHFGSFRPAGHPENELTWTVWDAAHEGRGLALEAASATRDHAFADLGWTTAVSYVDPANSRSQALAARLGAVRDAGAAMPPYSTFEVWRHPATPSRMS